MIRLLALSLVVCLCLLTFPTAAQDRASTVSGTVIDGRFVLRVCVLSFRTHPEHIEAAFRDLEETLVA